MAFRMTRCFCLVCGREESEVDRMHYFPSAKDKSRLWQEAMGMKFCGETLHNRRICSLHFTEDSYVDRIRGRLNRNAVPTLFPCLPNDSSHVQFESEINLINPDAATETVPDTTEEQLSGLSSFRGTTDNSIPAAESQGEMIVSNDSMVSVSDDNLPLDNTEKEENTRCSGGDIQENIEANSSIEKPYFKSIQCFISDCNIFTDVCRICFRSLTKEDEVTKLYGQGTSTEGTSHIKNMLKVVLPDLDLEMYLNCVICTTCVELLRYSYKLKEMWLSTEVKLQKIVEKKKALLNRDADLIIVKKAAVLPPVDSCTNISQTEKQPTKLVQEKILNEPQVYQHELNMNSSLVRKVATTKKRTVKRAIWGAGPYMCEQCGRIFPYIYNLKKHLLSHRNTEKQKKPKEHRIMCEMCGKLFKTFGALKSHRRIHDVEQKCPHCDKQFEHIRNLRAHIYYKHAQRSYLCHLCGKQYPYATSLRSHLLLHYPKRKQHACNTCDKKFFRPSHLRKHVRTHATSDLWNCSYCGKSLKYEYSLQKHIRMYHMNEPEFVCEFCNRPYWKNFDLKKHRIRVHGGFPEAEKVQEDSLLQNDSDFCSSVQICTLEGEL